MSSCSNKEYTSGARLWNSLAMLESENSSMCSVVFSPFRTWSPLCSKLSIYWKRLSKTGGDRDSCVPAAAWHSSWWPWHSTLWTIATWHFISWTLISNSFTFTVTCWFFNCSAASISCTSSAYVGCCDSDCSTPTTNVLHSLPNRFFCAFGNALWMAREVHCEMITVDGNWTLNASWMSENLTFWLQAPQLVFHGTLNEPWEWNNRLFLYHFSYYCSVWNIPFNADWTDWFHVTLLNFVLHSCTCGLIFRPWIHLTCCRLFSVKTMWQ